MALPELSTSQTPTHKQAHRTVVDVAAYFDLHGDGTTVNDTELVAARDSLGDGSKLILPEWELAYASSFVPRNGQSWIGAGRGDNNVRVGTRLKYTGTGTAWDLTHRNFVRVQDLEIRCTNASSTVRGVRLVDTTGVGSSSHKFDNVNIYGPSTSLGKGLEAFGQVGCMCHSEFDHVDFRSWGTLIHLSGFSNDIKFTNCWGGVTNQAIDHRAIGTDTIGGSDCRYERFELNGGTIKGIHLGSGANRNAFVQVTEEGSGGGDFVEGLVVDSGADDNWFEGGRLGPVTGTLSTTKFFLVPTFAYADRFLVMDNVNLYPISGTILATDGDFYATTGDVIAHQADATFVKIGSSAGAAGVVFGNAGDTEIHREAANLLRTEDKLVAVLGLGVGNSAAATTPGSVVKKMQVFDASGASLGYVAIYSTIT